ncbi:MAG: CHAT domain-containing protein [Acidobacteriota bacterium]
MDETPFEALLGLDLVSDDPYEIHRFLLKSNPSRNVPHRIELCRIALQKLPRDQDPLVWAALQFELGKNLTDLPLGDHGKNVEEAIRCLSSASEILSQDEFPQAWVMMQLSLGNAYRERITGTRRDNIEKAIACYETALKTIEPESETSAHFYVSLANAFLDRAAGDHTKNIDKAISFCLSASKSFTKSSHPEEWAKTQDCLSRAYKDRSREDIPGDMERAIDCLESALTVYLSPNLRAGIQLNLAVTYLDRIRGDRIENVERVIALCDAALGTYTRDDFPEIWAKLQSTLGKVFRTRIRGVRRENLDRSAAHNQAALEVINRLSNPELWAQLQVELAETYLDRGYSDRAQNIERAVAHYKLAAEVFSRGKFPIDWAGIQNGLGLAYIRDERGNRSELLDLAIRSLRAASEVLTRKAFPGAWARIQRNLADAYKQRQPQKHENNGRQAIDHYLHALEMFEELQMFGDQRDAGLSLGEFASLQGRWELAHRAYESALLAIEALRQDARNDESQKYLVASNDRVYWGAIVAAHQTGLSNRTLELIEAAKARIFLKQLGHTAFDAPTLVPTTLRFEEAGLANRIWELNLHIKHSTKNQELQLRLQRELEEARREQNAYYDRLETIAPDYASLRRGRPPSFAEIRRFVDEQPSGTLLLVFYDMPDRLLLLALLAGDSHPFVTTRPIDQNRLISFLISVEGTMAQRPGSNGEEYPVSWKQFSRELLPPELDPLIGKAERFLLVPSGLLYYLPLHALLWHDKPLVEHCSVLYTPSIAVAMRARSRDRNGEKPAAAFGYVEDPHLKPIFEGEAEEVAGIFDVNAQVGEEATPEAVVSAAKDARILHLSCHGFFDRHQPMQSGLVLSGGILTAASLLNSTLPGSLVTLSACLTGRSHVSTGDELEGLMRALFYAGASSVVLSLWSVDAEATKEFMHFFYARLKTGCDRAEAMRDAMLAVRRHISHPFYWAPFMLLGDAQA